MAKKKGGSYRIKFLMIITYLCAGLIPLFLFTAVVFKTTENYFIEEKKKELLNQANIFSGHITISGYLKNEDMRHAFDRDIELTSEQGGFRIIVTDDMGVVIEDSNGTDNGKTIIIPEIVEALETKDVAREQESGDIYVVTSIVDESGKKAGTVLIIYKPEDIHAMIAGIRKPVYIMTILISCIVLTFVLVLSYTLKGPLS